MPLDKLSIFLNGIIIPQYINIINVMNCNVIVIIRY